MITFRSFLIYVNLCLSKVLFQEVILVDDLLLVSQATLVLLLVAVHLHHHASPRTYQVPRPGLCHPVPDPRQSPHLRAGHNTSPDAHCHQPRPQPGQQLLQVPQPHETVQHDDTKHSELSLL